jgi:hypothetical protein
MMMAVLCLLGAWVGWTVTYALLVGLVLGFLTVVEGQAVILGEKLLKLPWWIHPAALMLAAVLLVWAAWDERCRRYEPVDDRPIIGWHVFSDIVLAPARLTLGVWGHASAVIRLNRAGRQEAFEVLRHIFEEGRSSVASLGAYFPDVSRLREMLLALQLAGWIDLHRGDDGPFYLIRSDEAGEVRSMMEPGDSEAATET